MEENLDKNKEVNKEISDNTTKTNSEEIKKPKSEKVIDMNIMAFLKVILLLKLL